MDDEKSNSFHTSWNPEDHSTGEPVALLVMCIGADLRMWSKFSLFYLKVWMYRISAFTTLFLFSFVDILTLFTFLYLFLLSPTTGTLLHSCILLHSADVVNNQNDYPRHGSVAAFHVLSTPMVEHCLEQCFIS